MSTDDPPNDPYTIRGFRDPLQFYLDDSRARVILSASDCYQFCNEVYTGWEIQPAIAWNDTSIVIEFNAGHCRAAPTCISVIDPSGNLSAPYEVRNRAGRSGRTMPLNRLDVLLARPLTIRPSRGRHGGGGFHRPSRPGDSAARII
jgi:hypothetical protein